MSSKKRDPEPGNHQASIEVVLGRLEKVSKTKNGWSACCPAHEDRNPSLSVAVGDAGQILLHCHAGCDYGQIVAAMGLNKEGGFRRGATSAARPRARRTSPSAKASSTAFPTADAAACAVAAQTGQSLVASWNYHDQEGEEVLRVLRLEPAAGGSKTYRPISRGDDGWRIGDPPGELPLYGLPRLEDCDLVFVAEGEKCADSLSELGFFATTSAHGAKSARNTNWEPLAGRSVVILPDHDEAGRRYAHDVCGILLALDPRPTIRIVDLPSLSEGEDVVDWSDRLKVDGSPSHEIKEILLGLAEGGIPIDIVHYAYSAHSAGASEIPIPRPLCDQRVLPSFPIDTAFPPALANLRKLVDAIANTYQVSVDLPAMLALPVAALALSKKLEVQPQPGWREVLAIWSLVLLPSGDRKSPVLSTLVGPVFTWTRQKGDAMRERIAVYISRVEVAKQRLKNAQRNAAGGTTPKKRNDLSPRKSVDELAQDLEALESEVPIPPSLITTEATTEAISSLLMQNGERGMVAAAEADALDVAMGRYSDGNPNLGIWCSSYTGEPIEVRRRSREPDRLQRPVLNVALAVQPDSIRGTFGNRQARSRGFLARMMVCHPRSMVGFRELQPPPVPEDLLDWWDQSIRGLLEAEVPDDPQVLQLSDVAESLFTEFRIIHEAGMRPGGVFGANHEWAAKLPGQLIRIAGVFQGLSGTKELVIDADTMAAVLSWAPYLIEHERFVAGLAGEDSELEIAKRILDWISRDQIKKEGDIDGTFSRRDAFNAVRGSALVKKVDEIDPALELLEDHDWIRQFPAPGHRGPGRKPSPRFVVHPDARLRGLVCAQNPHNTHSPEDDFDSEGSSDEGEHEAEGGKP